MNFKISIQKFTLLTIASFLLLLVLIFTNFYSKQREKTAEVILHSVVAELAQINYMISKNIEVAKDVHNHRALLERITVNNDFIRSIMVRDGDVTIFSTDPFLKEIEPQENLKEQKLSSYMLLMKTKWIEEKVRFYVDGQLQNLQLILFLEHDEIELYFDQKSRDFFLLFVFLPLVIVASLWMIVKKLVISPLELLGEFVFHHEKVPHSFLLQELETIRLSMIKTFTRLENEKNELYQVSRTDSLTNLANRNALMEYVPSLISSSGENKKEFAMLFLDLDRFKSVNDLLGHNIGDKFLRKLSAGIKQSLRDDDFIARVGGDEFVIIFQRYNSHDELVSLINVIQELIERTWEIEANPINIGSSVGIAFYPKDGEDVVTLMKNSDIAMYEAKKSTRSSYHFFTEELNQRVQESIKLEKEMKQALENGEYQLYYQPKVDIYTGKIIAAEALIRWNHPKKGMIPPNVFITLAEEDGFIIELGAWILQTALAQQAQFNAEGIDISLSINLSPKQLFVDNFAEDVIELMQKYNLNPKTIDMEITENLFFQYNSKNIEVLKSLQEYGITISLDDFGTGYSSLSYLKDFPLDYLKIDKTFIDDIYENRGRVFIETIVKMGQTLNLKIIAEGVEDEKQLEYLKSMACDQYQGYFCSKPLDANSFIELYKKQNS